MLLTLLRLEMIIAMNNFINLTEVLKTTIKRNEKPNVGTGRLYGNLIIQNRNCNWISIEI